jgi:hypothetical protein
VIFRERVPPHSQEARNSGRLEPTNELPLRNGPFLVSLLPAFLLKMPLPEPALEAKIKKIFFNRKEIDG